ncbi:MAG: hypothetical protein Q4G62_00990 [Pseudomonadota bacterium]|nr:hypothetical protein [Pseudomonadota bacterium]
MKPLLLLRTVLLASFLALLLPANVLAWAWSSYDFLSDQRWSQINNRLTNQRMDDMNRSVKKSSAQRSSSSASTPATPAANTASLRLGATASTDFSLIGDLIATTKFNNENVATVFQIYNAAAASLNVPANDSASGMAAFIAGTYAGYTGKPFPDAMYRPLYLQFAGTLAADQDHARMPRQQKIQMYQHLVLTGMVYQLAQLDLQASPNARDQATLRTAAGAAFKSVTGLSPDEVRFTANGMQKR